MYSNELICNILIYIENHLDSDIKIDDISNTFYFNRTYIMKKFKKEMGISIINYINTLKIYNALLDFKVDDTVLNIALKNGFNSLEYFSETFTKIVGINPSTYKSFISKIYSISDEDLYKTRDNISTIQQVKLNSINYLSRRKPTETKVKSLTLFK